MCEMELPLTEGCVLEASKTTLPRNMQLDEDLDDLPKLSVIISHLNFEFSLYKYTVYRCASKFVRLQKILHTSTIPYKLVAAVLERHNMKHNDSNFMVPPFQLTSLIHDIYFACEKLGHFSNSPSYNLGTATSVLLNFFWNIFDSHRRHTISLLEIKVTFLLLCQNFSANHLVSDFFSLICNPNNNCVSKYSFEYLISIFAKIFTYIGEGSAYGNHNIPLVMDQSYIRYHSSNGLNKQNFLCLWAATNNRFIIYANLISLIKRMEDTEKLIHNNSCVSCQIPRIVGIRFKCQTCKNLSLCLKCFATGFSSNKHASGHRMYEVFTEDLPQKKFSHYVVKFCNLFHHKNVEETKGFCNSNESSIAPNETELVTIEKSCYDTNNSRLSGEKEYSVIKEDANHDQLLVGLSYAASNAERLQSIIERLLKQNAKVQKQLECIQNSTSADLSSFLTSHQQFLIGIINEMRDLTQASNSALYPLSSTPNRTEFMKKIIHDSFANGNLSQSVNGADINRSYLDANKTDYSFSELSLWFHQRKTSAQPLSAVIEDDNDFHVTKMQNFKLLLNKVKEIVEDSFSDNKELADATQQFENALDNIIKNEEKILLCS